MSSNHYDTQGLHYSFSTDKSDVNHRRVVLFIHGFGGSSLHWKNLWENLPADILLMGVDLPGHGRSLSDLPDTMNDLIIILENFLKNIGTDYPIHLVGHSLGGLIALGLFLRNLEKFEKLTFISTAPNIIIHPFFIEQINNKSFDVDFLEKGLSDDLGKEDKNLIVEDMKSLRLKSSANDILGLSKINYSDHLSLIKNKALIICGSDDPIISPRRTLTMAKLMPCASFVQIPGAQHYPHIEHPGKVAQCLYDFLK